MPRTQARRNGKSNRSVGSTLVVARRRRSDKADRSKKATDFVGGKDLLENGATGNGPQPGKEMQKQEEVVLPSRLPDERPMVDFSQLAPRLDRIYRQVQLEGIFMHGTDDSWYWMDNCQSRRRTATLGEIQPYSATTDRSQGYDNGEIFFMDL